MVTGTDQRSGADSTAGGPPSPEVVFNGYIAAALAQAYSELGLFELLLGGERLQVDALAGRLDTDPTLLTALLHAGGALGYLRLRDGVAELTHAGRTLAGSAGYFRWLVGGYGEMLRNLAALAGRRKEYPRDVARDEVEIALACSQNGRAFLTPIVDSILDELRFEKIADCGCGDAGRLVYLCQRHPCIRAVGIDISAEACRLAEANVARAGLEARISIVHMDVLQLVNGRAPASTADADLVSSFFMLHDLLAHPGMGTALVPGLRCAFPAARHFLLADTMRMEPDGRDGWPPIFSVGFELTHGLMRVPLHPQEHYERIFAAGGLRTVRRLDFGYPWSWLYLLCTAAP